MLIRSMILRFKNPVLCLMVILAVSLLTILPAQAQDTATITGKISKSVSDSVLLEVYTVPASYTGQSYGTSLSRLGEFSLTVPMEESMLAELVHGSESVILYLQPGDELEVRLNANDFISSIKFKGRGTNENDYLVQFERKFQEEEDYQVLPDNVHKREKEFLQFLGERREDQIAFMEKFFKSSPVSKTFQQYAQAQIDFSYANDRITYADVRKRVGDLPPTLSPTYYDFLKEVNLNQAGAIRNHAYLEFLMNYFQHKTLNDRRGNPERDFYPAMYALAKKELSGPARDMMLTRILSQTIRFGYTADMDAMYLDFQQEDVQPRFAEFAKDQYLQHRKIGLGADAPAFTLLSASGDSVSLQSLLNQGKLVYLGFWRPACGICIVDMLAYKNFVAQLAAQDIVFVQVFVGDELAAWKQKATQKPLPAVQLYVPDQEAQIIKDYDLKTFPSYFLIAPDGTFVATTTKRPGHAEGARDLAAIINQYRALKTKQQF